MKTRVIGCGACNIGKNAVNQYLGRDLKDSAEIAIICGMPFKYEDTQNKAFGAETWSKLDAELKRQGVDTNNVTWVYACPCYQNPKTKITPTMEKHCRPKLMEYLQECGVKYALLVGDKAMRIFTNAQWKAITKKRGEIISLDGIEAMPVYDYSDVMRDRDLEPTFQADLRFFNRYTRDEFVKPDYAPHSAVKVSGYSVLVHNLINTVCVSYDLETEGFDHRKGNVKMLGLAWKDARGRYRAATIYPEDSPFAPFVHESRRWPWERIRELIKHFPRAVAHFSKFDNGWLISRDSDIHFNFDTALASHLENNLQPSKLKFLAREKLGAANYEDEIDHSTISEEVRAKMDEYCMLDCYYTLRLREDYLKEGLKFPNIQRNYQKPLAKLLIPGSRVLERIEQRGVYVNKPALEEAKLEIVKGALEYEAALKLLLPKGYPQVNYDSPAQLKKLLYTKEGFNYKPIYTNEYKKKFYEDEGEDNQDPTTGKAALKKLHRDGSAFAGTLLDYRKYSKALKGFIYPWMEMLTFLDRLYPKYNIAQTATGRLSCNDPNLQQVSRWKLIRNLIAAKPGYKFIEADYSQIELRVAAWLGRIHSMLRIYNCGGDIHVNTAMSIAALAGLDWSKLDKDTRKDFRTKAKAVNFGFIYGMSAGGFKDYADASYDVVLSDKEAQTYRNVYFGLYPELIEWHERSRNDTQVSGYTVSPFGRVRFLPNVNSIDNYLKGKALRCGINTKVQSGASDLTLLSMIDLEASFESRPEVAQLVGQCHDAIFEEVREDCVLEVCEEIHHIMTNPRLGEFGLYMDVPIEVEIKVGDCWGDPNAEIYNPVTKKLEKAS